MEELEAIITGRVQMVMFRDFTKRHGRKMNLLGTVENCPDGTVKVVAQGERGQLEAFIATLRKGSPLSRVDDITVSWRKPTAAFSGFDIVYHSLIDRI